MMIEALKLARELLEAMRELTAELRLHRIARHGRTELERRRERG